jgi:hypothetical protein
MSHHLRPLPPERFLVWDLLRESDPYYLNHHLIEVSFETVEADRSKRRAAGDPVPTYVAYALAAYGRGLASFPEFNSYLRMYPLTKLAVYDGVDVGLTIERDWQGRRVVLLGLLRDAQRQSPETIQAFLRTRKESPLETLEEFASWKRLLKLPAWCRWHLFQVFCKPFPELMRKLVGTTAFTSIGRHGTDLTTPISPRSCTLSLGRVAQRPWLHPDGTVAPSLTAWLTLTYDHRINDGAATAQLAADIKRRLETLELE